ncbi:hypothetical protein OK016_02395 [Vibrio chagasii]|nr:hypothetical protein [Vibrio chagasii]
MMDNHMPVMDVESTTAIRALIGSGLRLDICYWLMSSKRLVSECLGLESVKQAD